MTREDQIRKEVLFNLYGVRPLALTVDRLHKDALKDGYDFSRAEIRREAQFLADQGLIIPITDPGITAQTFRIHALGVTYFEQHYAA